MKPLLIIGSYLSPHVRKVPVCLEIKGIAYRDRGPRRGGMPI